ncbi:MULTISPECIES: hypothetical protein [Deinococcus]|uniref:DUF8082 domain-containing protein n=1 Tax=Deinococcus cavernae TaxID=2320857 RepID=A0A418V6W0_9DEIO|nr:MULTISPECIES: hypothetical protein [Deinococcus]RJF71819.1 hypothetical protein D3875_09855 [Deinococcus cavernae]
MTAATVIPQRPAALKDDTPLPFGVWQVLHLVDGVRSVQGIAAALNISTEQVSAALEQAHTWIGRSVQREQVVTDGTLQTVSQCLVSVMGPMAELIVDDALYEVGEKPTLAQVLSSIAAQLDEQHLHAFVRQLRTKGLA